MKHSCNLEFNFYKYTKQSTTVAVTAAKAERCDNSANERYRLSDRRLSAKLVLTFVGTGRRVVSATDPYGRNLGFLDQSRFLFQVAPQLYSWGCVNPIPDPQLLRKSGSAGNRTRTTRTQRLSEAGSGSSLNGSDVILRTMNTNIVVFWIMAPRTMVDRYQWLEEYNALVKMNIYTEEGGSYVPPKPS
jgi:hypothetical protein